MKTILAAVLAALLVACSTVQTVSPIVYQPVSTTTEHRVDTTYTIGTPIETFVGGQMLHVEDYYVTTEDSGINSVRLVPTSPFSLRVPPLMSVRVAASDIIDVVGTTLRDGNTFRVVKLPGAPAQLLRFLITEDGAFEGSALNHLGARMGWSYTPEPSSVRLIPAPAVSRIDLTKGSQNFELIYSGTTRDSFQLLYREYTQGDLARPAFSQTLVYDTGSDIIRFRNLQIQVIEATSERIRFIVLADNPGP